MNFLIYTETTEKSNRKTVRLLYDFGGGSRGKTRFIVVGTHGSDASVQIVRISIGSSAPNEQLVRRSGGKAVEVNDSYDFFIRGAVVIVVVIRRGDSGPAIIGNIDRIREQRSVPGSRKNDVVIHFPVHVPFQNHHVSGFFRSDGYVKRGNGGSVSRNGHGIRSHASGLNGFYLDDAAGSHRIAEFLDISEKLVPCRGRQGRAAAGFQRVGRGPYPDYRRTGIKKTRRDEENDPS